MPSTGRRRRRRASRARLWEGRRSLWATGAGAIARLARAELRRIPYERLGGEYRAAACALGIFGDSPEAARDIPNKAFHALACGTPLVMADTPAPRELLVDGESALLIPPADAEALARSVGDGGLAVCRENASEDVLGARCRSMLERAA